MKNTRRTWRWLGGSSVHCLVALFAMLLCPPAAIAKPSQRQYDQFDGFMSPVVAHTSWTGRDGAPQNISAMAQSTDGFLWLGTSFGLFRFDGMEFARYPTTSLGTKLPSIDIAALSADRSGGVWIGFRSGGITHLLPDGSLKNYNPGNHLGPNSVEKFVMRPDGSIWAIGDFRLYQFTGDHWTNVSSRLGLPSDPLFCLFFDRSGTLWTSTRHALFSLERNDTAFKVFPTQTFMVSDMAETPDGELWISDAWHTVRPLAPTKERPGWPINGYVRMVADTSGALWLAQDYRGVTHIPWQKVQPALVKENDLSSEQTSTILVDRDGDVWVGTARGLDRFRSTALTRLSNVAVEYYPGLSADPHHGVWIGTLAHPIVYASNGSLKPTGHAVGSSPMVCDDHGAVWMVDPIRNVLTRWEGPEMSRIPIPDEVYQAPAQSVGLDWDGALLISFSTNGLWRFDGKWSRVTDSELPQDEPLSIVRDNQNRVWMGYANSLIVVRDQNGYLLYPAGKNGDLGNVLTFTVSNGLIWAGGTNGLAYLDGGTFRRISLARGGSLTGVSGVVEDSSANLWLNSSAGILRIAHEQLADLIHTRSQIEYDLLDDREGVTGTATPLKPTPSAVADRDGSLWFSTSGQVISLLPSAVATRRSAPSLVIERMMLNSVPLMDREHAIGAATLLSSQVRELEIDYAAIDMTAPEKIVYRYMLEGEDNAWHEVGNRRQAFYSNLSPRQYHFRLAARSGSGQWVELAAPLLITVVPAFYQTRWFLAAIALLVAAGLYLCYILRVRYLTSSLKRRLQVRADERLRIARDLHDTLLQSIHGLMLRFHFATEGLPEEEPAREPLKLALQRADDVFVEARQRIEYLRDEVPDEPDFALQLTRIAEELDLPKVMTFRVIEEGQRRFLRSDVQTELCRIAREALINTLHHAKAPSAEICIVYGQAELNMKCSDTGIGISADVLREGRRSGHWGLIGMKERAAIIEAKLQLWSVPGSGAHIEVRVPGDRAYSFPKAGLRWLGQLRQFRRAATGYDTTV